MKNICYRIIEDVFYQSQVRKEVVDHDLVQLGNTRSSVQGSTR